ARTHVRGALRRQAPISRSADWRRPSSPAERFRDFVSQVRDDAGARGAVITAHKTSIDQHARDLLCVVEPISARLEEVSVIYRAEDGLRGTLIEPDSVATTLYQMGGGTPFLSPERDIVVYGAGGTARKRDLRAWPSTRRSCARHLQG